MGMTDMAYSRKERSISSWMAVGSIDANPVVVPAPSSGPPGPCGGIVSLISLPRWGPNPSSSPAWRPRGAYGGRRRDLPALSYVEEPHVIGVRRDEVLAQLDVVAHEDAAHLIGDGSFLDVDLQERAT